MFSKESSNSAQTQHKDFSDFLRHRGDQPSKGDANVFNKSDICQTKHFLHEKAVTEQKKQISFVKSKPEARPGQNPPVCPPKKAPTAPRHSNFKSSLQKDVWKTHLSKPAPFKKPKPDASSIAYRTLLPSSAGLSTGFDSQKGTRSFQKTICPPKAPLLMLPETAQILIRDEEFLVRFLSAFHDEGDLTPIFREYLVWVGTTDFQDLLDKVTSAPIRNLFKVSLIFERMSFYICYFIYARDFRKEEVIFLKKTTVHIYLNFIALVQELHGQIPEALLERLQQTIATNLSKFKITELESSVERNNTSILKIMDAQIQTQGKELSNCFYKIKNLASELSLGDGLKYLKTHFKNIVSSAVLGHRPGQGTRGEGEEDGEAAAGRRGRAAGGPEEGRYQLHPEH